MILVTGHEGFIGKRLTHELSINCLDWIGYDLEDGDDIRDYFKVNKVFRENNIDTVIHLAARAGVRTSESFPDEYITTNIIGTNNLLKSAEEYGVEKFISFSSSSVQGGSPSPNKESDPVSPDSIYAVTKATSEMLVKNSTIPERTVVRPFTVYGECGRKDQVIFKWINQIKAGRLITFFGDGETKRGYTYVGDLVKGVVKIVLNKGERKEFEIYNLGGSQIVTLKELLSIFQDVFPSLIVKKLPLPKGDVRENWADIDKAKRELGFSPDTDFKKTVTNIIISETK